MQGLGQLVHAAWALLPHWAFWVLAALGAVWFARGWRFRNRNRSVTEAVRRLVRAEAADREVLTRRALTDAGDDPDLLATLVREARKRSLPVLERHGLDKLATVPAGGPVLARLRAEATREHPAAGADALLWSLRVETMLADGLDEAARAALAEGLERWPTSAELRALEVRLTPAPATEARTTL